MIYPVYLYLFFGLATHASANTDPTFTDKLNFHFAVRGYDGSINGTLDVGQNGDVTVGNPNLPVDFAANGTKEEILQGKGTLTIAVTKGTRYLLMDPNPANNTQLKWHVPSIFPTMVRVTLNGPSQPRPMLHGASFAACANDEEHNQEKIITYAQGNLPEFCTPVNIYPVAGRYNNIPVYAGSIQPIRCYIDDSKIPEE